MNDQNSPQNGFSNQKRSIFDQPRKVVSGMVFSGVVIGMLFVSLLFSVTIAVISAVLQIPLDELQETTAYKYCSYLLFQILYLAVVLVFLKIYKDKPSDIGWRKTKPQYLLLSIPIAFGLLFSLNWVNTLFVRLLELMGYTMPSASVPSVAGGGFVGVLIVVALLPAILEETLFRGIILQGLKEVGTVAACLLGGLLFSVFHQNPAQTVYQFICGCVFTLLAIRADSLLPTVIVHLLNNAVILFDMKFGFLANVSQGGQIALYVISAVCLVSSLVYLIFIDKRNYVKKSESVKPFLLPSLAGLLLCILTWALNLFAGFGG